jgi:hypothetical protein
MPIALTNAQIRFLRGQAHDLKAMLQVGGKGISDALVAELDLARWKGTSSSRPRWRRKTARRATPWISRAWRSVSDAVLMQRDRPRRHAVPPRQRQARRSCCRAVDRRPR